MVALAIEIADTGLTALREGADPVFEPAYAIVDRDGLVLGETARAQSRLRPRQSHHLFWSSLSEDDVPGTEYTQADLAHAHLERVWQHNGEGVDRVVLVVPPGLNRDQLGLVLGLAQECGIPVTGMADAAVASCTAPAEDAQLIHLDAGRHAFFAAVIEQSAGGARRGRVAALDSVGLDGLRDLWVREISQLFLAHTRFDPFHDARSEQSLFDRLRDWLRAATESADPVPLALEFEDQQFETELDPAQLAAAAAPTYRALLQLLAGLREPGAPVVIVLGERLSSLPGLAASLARMERARLVALSPGAAVHGALARLEHFPAGGDAVILTRQLPFVGESIAVEASDVTPAHDVEPGRKDADERATHVVWRGVAHALGERPLVVGSEAANGARAIALSDMPGVSRRHCELRLLDDGALLTDLSRYGTFVNGSRAATETMLAPGDVLRIGTPGEELLLIRLEHDHGP